MVSVDPNWSRWTENHPWIQLLRYYGFLGEFCRRQWHVNNELSLWTQEGSRPPPPPGVKWWWGGVGGLPLVAERNHTQKWGLGFFFFCDLFCVFFALLVAAASEHLGVPWLSRLRGRVGEILGRTIKLAQKKTRSKKTYSVCVQAEPSKKPNIFSSLRIRADLNDFWWTREPTWRTFGKLRAFFFWQKKISEFTKRNFGCEFGIFFLPKKKRHKIFRKFAVLAPRSTKNYSNRPAS